MSAYSPALLAELERAGREPNPDHEKVLALGLIELAPWRLVSGQEQLQLWKGINSRYGSRSVLPVARRQDCDDVACVVLADEGRSVDSVLVIHDYASPGYEVSADHETFWAWFRSAIDDMIEWSTLEE